jgi:hypothetical protein
MKKIVKPEVEIREIDANIESEEFSQAVVAAFEEVMELKGTPISFAAKAGAAS